MGGRRTGALALLVTCSCGGSPDGIYRLEQRTNTDTCTPSALHGDRGEVAVASQGTDFQLPVDLGFEGATLNARYRWDWTQTGEVRTLNLPGCGGAVQVDITRRLLHEGSPLEASMVQRFTVPAGCDPSTELDSPPSPSASCEVDQTLLYTLVEVCEQPCTMRWTPQTGALRCECGAVDAGTSQ